MFQKYFSNFYCICFSLLDPANDTLPYEATVDINELIQVDEVMETKGVGPNGALVFCMEFLEQNVDWLLNKIKSLQGYYFIFDFPGQVRFHLIL